VKALVLLMLLSGASYATSVEECVMVLSKVQRDAQRKQGLNHKYIHRKLTAGEGVYGGVAKETTKGMSKEEYLKEL
jgi:hypothetical protein